MDYDQFIGSLSAAQPPQDLSPVLLSLWYDGKQDWESAHHVAQDIPGPNGSWIHAYLHRKEGDLFNARYWYRQAGKEEPASSLEDEWKQLVKTFVR